MKSPNFYLAIVIACGFFVSCSKDLDTTPVTEPPVQEEQVDVDDTSEAISGIKGQKAVYTNSISSNIGGYLEALPYYYSTTTKKFPLLISVHGIGELGNGTSDLWKIQKHLVPRLLYNFAFPKTFTVGGNTYSFIVVSPQFKRYPQNYDLNAVINYAIKKYRVDTTRIYLTGLSLGGGAIMNYAAAYGKRLAAIVPFCESNYPSTTHAAAIAKSGVKVWAFHNDYDTWVSSNYTKNYVTYINNNRPLVPARKTIFPAKGHNCWSKGSDPAYKENYMNIYQWMLSYKR